RRRAGPVLLADVLQLRHHLAADPQQFGQWHCRRGRVQPPAKRCPQHQHHAALTHWGGANVGRVEERGPPIDPKKRSGTEEENRCRCACVSRVLAGLEDSTRPTPAGWNAIVATRTPTDGNLDPAQGANMFETVQRIAARHWGKMALLFIVIFAA